MYVSNVIGSSQDIFIYVISPNSVWFVNTSVHTEHLWLTKILISQYFFCILLRYFIISDIFISLFILCKFDYFLFKHKNLCFKMLNHSIWISEVSFHNIPDSSLAISNLFYDLTWSHWSVQLCKSEFEFVHTNKNYFNGIIRCVCTQLLFHWKLTDDRGSLFLIVTSSLLGIDFSISKRNFVLIFTVCGSLNCPEEGSRISSYSFFPTALPT